jgi:hypothetical protein
MACCAGVERSVSGPGPSVESPLLTPLVNMGAASFAAVVVRRGLGRDLARGVNRRTWVLPEALGAISVGRGWVWPRCSFGA